MMNTAIIGAGNMGSSLFRGLAAKGKTDQLWLCDKHVDRRTLARKDRQCESPLQAAMHAECVLIAVKPQSFRELMRGIGAVWSNKLIISIMAGITMETIADATKSTAIVRAMPNLGARVQRCVTGWTASRAISLSHLAHTKELFSAIGTSVRLQEESQIDDFTAIAGSSPAYFFFLADLLKQRAEKLGVDAAQSAQIVRDVLSASALLLDGGEKDAAAWKEAVTSKGGVTETVLQALDAHDFSKIFSEALDAGVARSRFLSQQ